MDKVRIQTSSGKAATPDGFAFCLADREWYLIECELLKHGVWPHIAQQITRFVVTLQNQATLRSIRDKLFEQIVQSGALPAAAKSLETDPEHLLQQIETFIEAVKPGIIIFIDESNQDLADFAHALDLSFQVFRVRKFVVNGVPEYYSPDHKPVVKTEAGEGGSGVEQDLAVIEKLGGGKVLESGGRFKCYRLKDGEIVHIKRSKLHEKQNYYWYGIAPSVMDNIEELGVTHLVFVLGTSGFVKVPIEIVKKYLKTAKASTNPDGSIRHYHVLISGEPEPRLYWSSETPVFPLSEYFQAFD